MNINFSTIGSFFTTNEKLLPPILTGCVTISIFLFTIWKDKIKEKRKKQNDNAQKNIYLFNLLHDAGKHIQNQIKNNEILLNQLRDEPLRLSMLDYMPVNYLERLSQVLANHGYFAAFNSKYDKIEEHNRIRIYNDLAVDIDSFYSTLKQLYLAIESAGKFYDEHEVHFLDVSKTIIKRLSAFEMKLEDIHGEDVDCDSLCQKLNKLPAKDFLTAMSARNLSFMNDEFIQPTYELLLSFMIPHFPLTNTLVELCHDCQDAQQEFNTLINANKSVQETVERLNMMLQQTVASFNDKLFKLEVHS